MAFWRFVQYFEDARNPPVESYATDASRVVRTLLFFKPRRTDGPNQADREEIAKQFLGYSSYHNDGVGGRKYVSRVTPHRLPYGLSGTGPYLYATRILSSEFVGAPLPPEESIRGAPGDRGALYPCWRVNFEYTTLPYDIREDAEVLPAAGTPLYVDATLAYPDEGDKLRQGWSGTRFITKQMEPGGRVIPLRQGLFFYEGSAVDGKARPTLESIPYNETIDIVNYQIENMPIQAVPWVAMSVQKNTVNSGMFDGYAKGTLLFLSARVVPKRDPFGQRVFSVGYRFMWAPRYRSPDSLGHNAILRVVKATQPTWTLTTTNEDGSSDDTKRIYRYTDFGNLFRPDQ